MTDTTASVPLSPLDAALAEFAQGVNGAYEAAAPGVPDAAERLAEIEAIRSSAESFKNEFIRQLDQERAAVQPVLDEQRRSEAEAERQQLLSAVRARHGFDNLRDTLISAAIVADDPARRCGKHTPKR